ncbi:MAG TPA: DUF3418 domain-containing protein, partial [Syntrophales bacterium]|nr:DUF3418 domain-containing protein [Syntrophales bacterium]
MGAIESVAKDKNADDVKQYTLTERGRVMARLPIDPRISRMIIEADKEGCVEEILIIAAALSIQDPRERPMEFEKDADEIHAGFANPSSDFMTLLHIWDQYHSLMKASQSKSRMKKFCWAHYLSFRRMGEWIDVYDQLKDILEEQGWNRRERRDVDNKALYDGIHKSILSGYLSNIAAKKEKNIYTAAKGKEVMIFPGSGLFNKGGSWIVASEMIETSRLFARTAANVKMEWLEELGGNLCRSNYSEPHWSRDRGEVVAYEQVSLFGLVIVSRRPVSYGRINPDEASKIFIRSALVEGDVKRPLPFLIHNLEVIEQISNMEDKIRRRNLIAGEHKLAMFYKDRLTRVYDVRTLQKLIKERGTDDFLRMKEEDVLARFPGHNELAAYPNDVIIDGHRFTCDYRYEPGHPEDGVTLKVPLHMISTVSETFADWIIPGLIREKIAALLKNLPKEYKKKLPPMSQTCDILVTEMNNSKNPLLTALSNFIHERFHVDIPASVWNPDSIDDHLKVRFAVIDSRGLELASGRDISLLQKDIAAEAESQAFIKARLTWEKTGLTSWNFGELPDAVTLESGGCFEGYAYPGLEACEGCVNIRLFKSKKEADVSHNCGVAALYAHYFKSELKYLKKALTLSGDLKVWAGSFCGAKKCEEVILEKVTHDLFSKNIRTHLTFIDHAQKVAGQILPMGQYVINKIKPVLKSYYGTVIFLQNLKKTNCFNKRALQYLTHLRDELGLLIPYDFLIKYDDERLTHIIRYLKAISIRAERGISHLDKAFTKTAEIKIFSDKLQDMVDCTAAVSSEEKFKAIEEYRWMIEEYKVSVFAQELKTAFPVSQKRLEIKVQEIERII